MQMVTIGMGRLRAKSYNLGASPTSEKFKSVSPLSICLASSLPDSVAWPP